MNYLRDDKKVEFAKILKVGLFVSDLSLFAALNAEYVNYFDQKPPVRVCVEIPGNEVIAYFVLWNDKKNGEH